MKEKRKQREQHFKPYDRLYATYFKLPKLPGFFNHKSREERKVLEECYVAADFLKLLFPTSKIRIEPVNPDPPDVVGFVNGKRFYIELTELVPQEAPNIISRYREVTKK